MSIFSNLFGRAKKHERSYHEKTFVRTWVNRRMEEMRKSKKVCLDDIFTGVMYYITFYGSIDTNQKLRHDSAELLSDDVIKYYSSDAALFELACYSYIKIDLWLFCNNSKRRIEIMQFFANELVNLFTEALQSKNIGNIFDQRISVYAQLLQMDSGSEALNFHLLQLILRTKDNSVPCEYNLQTDSSILPDFFEETELNTYLTIWESTMIPTMIEAVKKFSNP